jgi:hypothetical protein
MLLVPISWPKISQITSIRIYTCIVIFQTLPLGLVGLNIDREKFSSQYSGQLNPMANGRLYMNGRHWNDIIWCLHLDYKST